MLIHRHALGVLQCEVALKGVRAEPPTGRSSSAASKPKRTSSAGWSTRTSCPCNLIAPEWALHLPGEPYRAVCPQWPSRAD